MAAAAEFEAPAAPQDEAEKERAAEDELAWWLELPESADGGTKTVLWEEAMFCESCF